ncbi:serine/threonine protein kinase [Bdellovibrio sp. HCB209]|uniref:serine/threonine protein kinase n=1 Tax=Bdellovibrio sp. HCB209 TaxID=3394354 RepID=UPI0039B36FDB
MNTLKKIGPYQIIKRIAEGGMAEVYLGKTVARLGVSKLVAIKTTLQSENPDQLREMFFNEIRLCANLNHQNIVKIHDFGEFENRGYMAMEYVNGVTLRELMSYLHFRNERLSSSFILYIIHQVSLALAYAYQSVDPQTGHPLKLIHRDISPHNILLSFEGEVKLIDFGIATAPQSKDMDTAGKVRGKVAYMSPEQVQGKELDSRTDIFSLGVVLWELLSNERFFAGTTVEEVKNSILSYNINQVSNVKIAGRADELLGILPIMLHQQTDKRAGDANELARLLGTVLSSLHPDFSALALADYLKDIFSTVYMNNLEQIRESAREDEKTIATAIAGAQLIEDTGDLDEFETKIMEGSYHRGISLEKLAPPAPPEVRSLLTTVHDTWGSVMAPRVPAKITVIPFYQFPKMRKAPVKQRPPLALMAIFAISFVMVVASGISMTKLKFGQKQSQLVAAAEVPEVTPAMIQELRLSVQQQPANPEPVEPAITAPSKKTTAANRKAPTKGRNIASVKNGKTVATGKVVPGKKGALNLEHFKYGAPYPSGAKCLSNCPIKIGAQAD